MYFSLVFVVIAVVGWGVNLTFDRRRPRTAMRAVELALVWSLAVLAGAQAVVGAILFVLFPKMLAATIGWHTSPFEFENAMGDLATGVLGLLCIWLHGRFWLATIIATSIQLTGDAVGHIYQLVVNHDTAANNAGIQLWTDIGTPLVLIVLGLVYLRLQQGHRGTTAVDPPR